MKHSFQPIWNTLRIQYELIFQHTSGIEVSLLDDEIDGAFIGRDCDTCDILPHVNLTEMIQTVGAQGVSRLHAQLVRREHVTLIIDLNSRNGTYLNGLRLAPYQLRVLRNNDRLKFGDLDVSLYFKDLT